MANPMLGEIWPVDYPDGAEGWQQATYTDGRPGAGVLATNGTIAGEPRTYGVEVTYSF